MHSNNLFLVDIKFQISISVVQSYYLDLSNIGIAFKGFLSAKFKCYSNNLAVVKLNTFRSAYKITKVKGVTVTADVGSK